MRVALEQFSYCAETVTFPVYKDQHDLGVVPDHHNPYSWNWLITCNSMMMSERTQTLRRVALGFHWFDHEWQQIDNYTDQSGMHWLILKLREPPLEQTNG